MIETDKRKAAFLLHQEGQSVREIARLLGLSRNTVKLIIQQQGAPPPAHPRADKFRWPSEDEALLRRLYQQCQGWVVRVHEKLLEEDRLPRRLVTHRLATVSGIIGDCAAVSTV